MVLSSTSVLGLLSRPRFGTGAGCALLRASLPFSARLRHIALSGTAATPGWGCAVLCFVSVSFFYFSLGNFLKMWNKKTALHLRD